MTQHVCSKLGDQIRTHRNPDGGIAGWNCQVASRCSKRFGKPLICGIDLLGRWCLSYVTAQAMMSHRCQRPVEKQFPTHLC